MTKRSKTTRPLRVEATGYEVVASIQTDKGCVREVNEDHGRHFSPGDPAQLAAKGVLTIVADGMGGHACGEVASEMAVEHVSRLYYEAGGDTSEGDVTAALRHAVEDTNRRIYAASLADKRLSGMGTTCTALVVSRGQAFAAHVGDSRLYILRGGEIYLLTEDHSAVMELVRRGVITADEARRHEDKNIILRALGTAPEVEVSMWERPLPIEAGDQFLLCSDGLCDMVEDDEIKRTLLASSDPHAACEQLVSFAKQRGGHDNITVGVVCIMPEGTRRRRPRITRELEAAL